MDKANYCIKQLEKTNEEPIKIIEDLTLTEKAIEEGLGKILHNPGLNNGQKFKIIDKVLGKYLSKDGLAYVKWLTMTDNCEITGNIIKGYAKQIKTAKGVINLEIITARRLDEKKVEEIKREFERKNKKEVIIKNTVSDDLVGGAIIKIDDKTYDNSIKRKINDLYKNIIS